MQKNKKTIHEKNKKEKIDSFLITEQYEQKTDK